MEPERKIEKWLRAYAKKRKGQAGGLFDLHPATRRLLHGEIARNTLEREGKDDETASLWKVFRRGWAYLLGFALCIFLIAAVFFHELNSSNNLSASKQIAQSTAAPADLAQFSKDTRSQANNEKIPETPGALATNAPLSQKLLTDSFAAGRSEITNDEAFYRLTNNTTPPTLAYNTSAAAQPAAIPQPATPMPSDGSKAASPTGTPPPPEVASVSPAVAPPPPSTMAGENSAAAPAPAQELTSAAMQPALAGTTEVSMLSGRKTVQAASRQKLASLQNRFKNTSATRDIPVLTKFQVQQNGNTIRIVDRDGSIYEGSLFQGEPNSMQMEDRAVVTEQVQAPEGASTAPENTTAAAIPAGSIPSGNVPQEKPAPMQSYFFMVYGMNRTLNQNVVFTGNFKANAVRTESLQKTPQMASDSVGSVSGFGGGRWANTNQFAQFPWSNLLIKGTAIINHTNRIPINAKPNN